MSLFDDIVLPHGNKKSNAPKNKNDSIESEDSNDSESQSEEGSFNPKKLAKKPKGRHPPHFVDVYNVGHSLTKNYKVNSTVMSKIENKYPLEAQNAINLITLYYLKRGIDAFGDNKSVCI